MDVCAVLASGIILVVRVCAIRVKEGIDLITGRLFQILKSYNPCPVEGVGCVLPMLSFSVRYAPEGAAILPGSARFLYYCVLTVIVLGASLTGYKLFARKEKEGTHTLIAHCGALCSECLYFHQDACPSCPEGPPGIRESCLIFTCSSREAMTCYVCSEFMRCKTFSQERMNCPFEKELFPLQLGIGYVLYEKNAEKSIYLFKDYLNRGEFGLLVSRRYPKQMKEKFDMNNIESVWLSTSEGEETWIDPCNLSKLHHVISDFIRNRPVSIVLFEGFEYLMVRNSFLTALKFVQSLMDEINQERSHLLLSINPDAFEKQELALIRRELVVL
ncbi:MAG: DUF835 domain-containing protein [Theionarchaea archaeon]|nr:DUF835 domain-containing protein [Theionarchaea archaeon]